ncbi:transmembrane and coiled-coil domain-containing protein 4 [Poecilia reticulata]|uniref:Transmembrane and coiled-coil domains 4 n=1 Tax=Poecilia reticulata TaxID=8081 RepID=A0A3P9P777_POERE|nr:PREDICTED: transmembrane and coiled-coil domain-containing protein 4 [Poecilia reticulata]
MEEKQSNADFSPDPGGAAAAGHEPEKITSHQLTEQSRFAFAALCAVSVGQLFSGSENSAFREQYLQDLVQWLGLDQSVMPVMGAFLSGLGSEGTDTFLSILQADPLVAAGVMPIIQGKRPVSLIGFSLGARVIYYCLQELASDKGSEGVVEDVVLLGAPVDGSEKSWERMVRVVAGRIVNGYCRGDWLLGFLYRSSAAQLSVAGLQPINIQDHRIINVDLSSVVKGHLDYMRQMDTILVAVGVPTKEVAGASFVLPQSVRATQKPVDDLDRAEEQHQASETQNPAEKDKTSSQESADWRDETEDMGDGWDIPDITDLLDSLNETEPNDGVSVLNNVSPNNATSSNFIAQNSREEAEPDDEQISWSWNDTHWTADHLHK